MIKITITGDNADEVYQQLMNLSRVPDFCYHPFEYNSEGKVIGYNPNAVKKGAVYEQNPAEESATTIEPDNHNYTPEPAPQPKPAPASKPTVAEKVPSLDDLKNMAAEIGTLYGREAFLQIKQETGVESMSKLTESERINFMAYMKKYIKKHPQAKKPDSSKG